MWTAVRCKQRWSRNHAAPRFYNDFPIRNLVLMPRKFADDGAFTGICLEQNRHRCNGTKALLAGFLHDFTPRSLRASWFDGSNLPRQKQIQWLTMLKIRDPLPDHRCFEISAFKTSGGCRLYYEPFRLEDLMDWLLSEPFPWCSISFSLAFGGSLHVGSLGYGQKQMRAICRIWNSPFGCATS